MNNMSVENLKEFIYVSGKYLEELIGDDIIEFGYRYIDIVDQYYEDKTVTATTEEIIHAMKITSVLTLTLAAKQELLSRKVEESQANLN